jgi:hypothetical protein
MFFYYSAPRCLYVLSTLNNYFANDGSTLVHGVPRETFMGLRPQLWFTEYRVRHSWNFDGVLNTAL